MGLDGVVSGAVSLLGGGRPAVKGAGGGAAATRRDGERRRHTPADLREDHALGGRESAIRTGNIFGTLAIKWKNKR